MAHCNAEYVRTIAEEIGGTDFSKWPEDQTAIRLSNLKHRPGGERRSPPFPHRAAPPAAFDLDANDQSGKTGAQGLEVLLARGG